MRCRAAAIRCTQHQQHTLLSSPTGMCSAGDLMCPKRTAVDVINSTRDALSSLFSPRPSP